MYSQGKVDLQQGFTLSFVKKKHMRSDFNKMLGYEQSQMGKADRYYTERWKVDNIERFSWKDPKGREMQRRGVDCRVQIGERTILISEKFRRRSYGDMMIELWCGNSTGWGITDTSEILCYFTNRDCYTVQTESMKKVLSDFLTWFEESNLRFIPPRMELTFKDHPVLLQETVSQRDGNVWKAVNLVASWENLKELGLKFKQDSLTGS